MRHVCFIQIAALESSRQSGIDAKTRDEMLVCIGVEHSKVQALSAKLLQLGYDPDVILTEEMDKQV